MNPEKTSGQNAAFEKRPQFPLHESRNGALPFILPRKPGFKMAGNNAVKGIVFGIAGAVFGGYFADTMILILCIERVVCGGTLDGNC